MNAHDALRRAFLITTYTFSMPGHTTLAYTVEYPIPALHSKAVRRSCSLPESNVNISNETILTTTPENIVALTVKRSYRTEVHRLLLAQRACY